MGVARGMKNTEKAHRASHSAWKGEQAAAHAIPRRGGRAQNLHPPNRAMQSAEHTPCSAASTQGVHMHRHVHTLKPHLSKGSFKRCPTERTWGASVTGVWGKQTWCTIGLQELAASCVGPSGFPSPGALSQPPTPHRTPPHAHHHSKGKARGEQEEDERRVAGERGGRRGQDAREEKRKGYKGDMRSWRHREKGRQDAPVNRSL